MNSEQLRIQIKEVRDLTAQYGPLVKTRTLTFPNVLDIINYYEEDGENQAVLDAEARVEEIQSRLSKAQGAAGGLTRRINKLEEKLNEMENVKSNNSQLARIANHAHDLVEYITHPNNNYVDVQGDKLDDLPLLVRLVQEIGE